MTLSLRLRRAAIVVGVVTTALLLPIAGASPALANGNPEITDLETTDGTVDGTGDYETYVPGTELTLRINGSDTGTYSFTGCVAMQTYTGTWATEFTTVNPSTFTWTAGTSMEALIPGFIDMDAESGTEYYLELFVDENGTAGTCEDIWNDAGSNLADYVASVQIQLYDPESMTLTGTAKFGNKVTVAAKVPGSLVGLFFDLWACPDTTIYPDNNSDADSNGECYGPLTLVRDGNSAEILLGYDPERDGDSAEDKAAAEEEWANFCGNYFIVHDFEGGGHSNWIGPIDCTDADEPTLADTGADDSAITMSLAALAAMLIGGTLLIVRRTAQVSKR